MRKTVFHVLPMLAGLGLAGCDDASSTAVVLTNPGNPQLANMVDWGDDGSDWANDDECDDPRFEGPGMTDTPLLDADIRHDATDCRTAFEAGELQLRQ